MECDKSFSLYVHIPFCVKKCSYCDFFSLPVGKSGVPSSYVKALINEISFFARKYSVQNWKSVYIGGGTPSLLSAGDLLLLCKGIESAAPFSSVDFEFTVEANPDDITKEFLEAAWAGGVNRISAGVQSLDDKVLQAAGRRCSRESALSGLNFVSALWKGRFSTDLIAGLPYQTEESLFADIAELKELGSDHVSMYSLCLEEGTPLEKSVSSGILPYDSDAADEMWLKGRDCLESQGFLQYEVSNFAKSGCFSRHNMNYWKLGNYIGCGAGASGSLYSCYGTVPVSLRYTVRNDVAGYVSFWGNRAGNPDMELARLPLDVEMLKPDTEEYEFLMMNLRTFCGVDSKEFEARFGKALDVRLGADGHGLFSAWQKKALAVVEKKNGSVQYALSKEGMLFLNSFLEKL